MTGDLIALNASPFWLTCLAAMIVLVPLTRATARRWALAGLNLAFLVVLLGRGAAGLLAAVLVAYLLLQAVERRRLRGWAALALGVGALGLFVLHKRPTLTTQLGLAPLGRVLSLVGFSYVALRIVEVLRAVWERRSPAPGPASLINYLLPFHMLAAGPIQAYDDFARRPDPPPPATPRAVLAGAERIATGVSKKFVLAWLVQQLFLTDFRAGGAYFLIELQACFLWLYLDFSAYSDIAVGVGTLIGVATPENFNRPLLARNVIEFWERWHISLSQFIRRNLFIPIQMALMRRTDGRWPLPCAITAIVVSFGLCGLWHGVAVPFLAWGLLQALGLVTVYVYVHILQRTLGSRRLKVYRANPWIRALAILVTFEFEACTIATLYLI
jgi:D-alanyl-lipoteichoic acid acyltransferase DltB (MBOAT superfamily)